MKVLMIGGNGNISWHCTHKLITEGHEVYVLNRGVTVLTRKSLDQGTIHLIADIANSSEVGKVLADHKFDVVVDFLCYKKEHAYRDITMFGKKTKQFIFISSAANYKREGFSEPITEDRLLEGNSWEYSKNKIICEKIFMEAYKKDGFPVTIIRPGHTYDTLIPEAVGNGDWTIAKRIIEHRPIVVHGNGRSLWTLTHSKDFAEAFFGVVGKKESVGESYHITSDEVLTWSEITKEIASFLGNNTPNIVYVSPENILKENYDLGIGIIAHKMWNDVYDNRKIKALVPGWEAHIKFQDGIRETISWLLANKARQRVNVELDQLIDKISKEYGCQTSL